MENRSANVPDLVKVILWLAAIVYLVMALTSPAAAGTPSWQPNASERLVKLPSTYLKKAIDRDFEESDLAAAMSDVGSRIAGKSRTLEDLQAAVEQAEGEVKTELRHQFLAEKQEFIRLVGERQELRQKQINIRIRVYEKLLAKLERRGAGSSPAGERLLEKQKEARQRFENSVAAVDMKLFGSAAAGESKYARDYSKNMAVIETLVRAVKKHPMSAEPEIDGRPISKQDYLRQLIASNESSLALLDQEESILGYMAKLVALDAMALAEEVATDDGGVDGVENGELSVLSAVDFFINQ